MLLNNIQIWVQIISSIVTILVALAAGWWFYTNRSLAGTAQITLMLKDVTIANGSRIAIVGVRIKNLGRTRIIKGRCTSVVKEVYVRSYSESIHILREESLDYSRGLEVFKSLREIEPNEEISGDIPIALNNTTLFMVGVKLKKKGTTEGWQTSAVFNVGDKTKVPSSAGLPTAQVASAE